MGVGVGWVEMKLYPALKPFYAFQWLSLQLAFFEYEALLGNLGHFDCFLTGGGWWVNCIKKRTDRQYEAGAPV